ncbi:MAG: preprotein translocase subunit SecG [Candidatus Eremiobacter antarcticus]|nr:MAG: preprotein translocase subunit SecG [Candidatus Eremiobacteraeota bacterium]PZR64337.1 MAG: preprotein translocase subunit SecG [Candidatus Eremiobacter sp. RRmetagenome_bin22]
MFILLAATPPPQALPQVAPHTWIADHAGWLTHGLVGLAIVLAFALIVLLAIQTTKQEGLSGTIGGRVDSPYRGRLGMEENLKRVTGMVAVSFVVVVSVLSLTGF